MQQITTNRKKNLTFTLTATAMLTAMIVVLAFTPIGYIRVFALSITLVIVPVIIGAIALGPAAGAFLGFVFGCTSFAQCFMGDALGAILISVSPVGTFVNCVVTRTLVGLLCGLIFRAVQKTGKWSYAIAGASGALLNTILFLGCLALIFGRVKFTAEQAESLGGLDSVMSTIIAIAIGVNCPIEIAVCAIFGSAIGGAVTAAMKRFNK
ncbi:MAG: ECF transporter S component [Clostridia bacterium]|nr:ECF transporter S component [Clostridia bacterium]